MQDFENTIILAFKTEDIDEKADEDYKINWRDLETYIKENYDQIKVVYSRSDKYDGHIAVSSHHLNKAQFQKLAVQQQAHKSGVGAFLHDFVSSLKLEHRKHLTENTHIRTLQSANSSVRNKVQP